MRPRMHNVRMTTKQKVLYLVIYRDIWRKKQESVASVKLAF